MAQITFTLNGRVLCVEEGTTILQAARDHQIDIPTLCFLEGLSASGSCRLCVVDIQGERNSVTACSTPVQSGMVIETESESLHATRRQLLEMLFAAGHHVCAICVSNGHCELQALAQSLGVTVIDYPNRQPEKDLDLSHERFGFDPNRCVLCTRCLRTCEEIEGAGLWAMGGRGSNAFLQINQGLGWGDAERCTSCGKCVIACPTGALFDKHASAGEMTKNCELLARLAERRSQQDA